MYNTLKVHWTIIPQNPPQPWAVCNGCGGYKPFKSSGKLRLNANGKKLDAWLIYKCVDCDKTWNRVLFERRNIREIDAETLEALQSNDPEWIRKHAFDVEALKRKTERIDEFAEITISKRVLSHAENCNRLEICMSVALSTCMRLDRLLAMELAISRSRLQSLYETARLTVDPNRKGELRRSPGDGLRVVIDLSSEPDRQSIVHSACDACRNGV